MNGKPRVINSEKGGHLAERIWEYRFVPPPTEKDLKCFNIQVIDKKMGAIRGGMEFNFLQLAIISGVPTLRVRYNDWSKPPLPLDSDTYVEIMPVENNQK